MLSAIAIGDLHLDGMLNDLGDDANRLQIAEVAKAEAWAVRNGIDHVFYLGDICNKSVMSYDAHERLVNLWRTNTHLRRHVILGNHDVAERGVHSLRLLERMAEFDFDGSVKVYTKPTQVEISGINVNFLPYPYPNSDIDLDLRNAVNVSHFEVSGSLRDNGTANTSAKMKVIRDSNVWIMGHLHTPHDVGNVHYVGTLYQRNFGESANKSFTWLRAKLNNGVFKYKLERIGVTPSFRLVNVDIERVEDLQSLQQVQGVFYKLFVKRGVVIPDNLLACYPNILRVEYYVSATERDVLVANAVIRQSDVTVSHIFDTVEDYLREHHQLNEVQLKRAVSIINEINGV